MRIGKRFDNTYISTNGRNVRVTRKISKNIYVSKQFGNKSHRKNAEPWDINSIITIIIMMFCLWMTIYSLMDYNTTIINDDYSTFIFWAWTTFIAPLTYAFGSSIISTTIITRKFNKQRQQSYENPKKLEREFKEIIDMYPSMNIGSHESIVHTVRQYRQFEYNQVLEKHKQRRSELYKILFNEYIKETNDIDEAIELTLKWLDENFDWNNE